MTGAGRYLRSVVILRAMLDEGIIGESDFAEAEAELARRNGIETDSILRPNPLINSGERAINVGERKDDSHEEDHQARVREIAR